jgi:hypothetical protein
VVSSLSMPAGLGGSGPGEEISLLGTADSTTSSSSSSAPAERGLRARTFVGCRFTRFRVAETAACQEQP